MVTATDLEEEPMATPGGARHLPTEAQALLRALPAQPSGRLARTLSPGAGAPLKQTLLALRAGHRLQDHRAPGQATIEVLAGRVRLTVHDGETVLETGSWAPIPSRVHGLAADEDSVALLTVASADGGADAGAGAVERPTESP
jgi:quercetin dioxygenase-like cupin family protein